MYSKTLFAGWSDMDPNNHMRNTAYIDKSANVRMMFFAENGFSINEFTRVGLAPIVVRDEIEYQREVSLLQEITVTLAIAGMSEDGSNFIMHNEILRADGKICAIVRSTGAWIDINMRKRVAPPGSLLTVMQSLQQTADFSVMATGVKVAGV